MPQRLFHLRTHVPPRDTLAVIGEQTLDDPLFGPTTRKRLFNLRHFYDPKFPAAFTVGDDSGRFDPREVRHPLELLLAEGPRPDPRHCLQRLRALWLLSENRSGQLDNDPVLPLRHQAALVDFLARGEAPRRLLIADEVGLGKTVEAGLLIRRLLRRNPGLRVLYLTLGGLVENVLGEFDRLDLPRWSYFGNISEDAQQRFSATPLLGITEENRLVIASIHKLCAAGRLEEQRRHLGDSRFDVLIVDECHTLRAYGPAAESPQVWFRAVRSLLEHHLVEDGRVLFLSATPHQGHREVFLNLIALCTGVPLSASEAEKSGAAHGRVVFRIKEHIRDWEGHRIFPPREVRLPEQADAPANYMTVLGRIADHFDWIAQSQAGPQARAVGFVKSQALQYAASSLRAGFAYLLRRLIRYYPRSAGHPDVQRWAARLVPYRGGAETAVELLELWTRERSGREDEGEAELLGALTDGYGDLGSLADEEPRLHSLLAAYDALFDDPNADAKVHRLIELLAQRAEPAVVFSQAVDTVHELAERLRSTGIEVYRLTGDMGIGARMEAIRAFRQSANPRRVLASSAAGGIGINLQVARWVIHFDLPWNPMALEQRVGRVHRIGSTRTILVDTILLAGSREADVFERITARLEAIVSDLSADPVEREAFFRRILASLDPERLREIFSGDAGLDEIGAAVDAGRRAVEAVDRDLLELRTGTTEERGLATTDHLMEFIRNTDAEVTPAGRRRYAVIVEGDGGHLQSLDQSAEFFQMDGEEEPLVFDRVAASYLGLRRRQTGGLGHPLVDPLIRTAIDVQPELEKAKTSTWLASAADLPEGLRGGDVVLVELVVSYDGETFANPRLVARVAPGADGAPARPFPGEQMMDLLWGWRWKGVRKAGEHAPLDALVAAFDSPGESPEPNLIRWPVAAIGIRDTDG